MPSHPPAGIQFAVRTLAGFDRISLARGTQKLVSIHLPPRRFQYWDQPSNSWRTIISGRTVYAGSSSRDLPLHQMLP